MRKKKLNAGEMNMKIQEQRFGLIITLCNVIDTESGVSAKVKSAICASLINMMDVSFMDEDEPLPNLINNSIDNFCKEIEEKTGVRNYRKVLMQTVIESKQILEKINEKVKRIREGEDILKNISLN